MELFYYRPKEDLSRCPEIIVACHNKVTVMTLQPFKNEQLNYFKFAFVVLHEFPKVLRQAFKTRWNTLKHLHGFQPWDDSVTVRNLFLTTEGGSTKVPTHLSYDDWDCTALFQATIFANSFSMPDGKGIDRILSDLFVKPLKLPPNDLHTSVISSTGNDNESFTLAIDQLRRLRNEVCHPPSPEIPKATFDKYIQLTKDAFQVLGVSSSSVDTIGSLTDADFPIERVRKLEDEIKKELQAKCAFLIYQVDNYLMGIRSDIAEANQERRNETERTVTEIKEEIEQLKNQLQEQMKRETLELKETIRSNIEQSNQTREKDAASAAQDRKQEIQELRKQLELATLSIPQQEMSQRLAELTQKIDDILTKTTKQGKIAAVVCVKDYFFSQKQGCLFFPIVFY